MSQGKTLLQEWKERLRSVLRLSKLDSPDAWIYEVRSKVLKYFISRYGDTVGDQPPFVPKQIPEQPRTTTKRRFHRKRTRDAKQFGIYLRRIHTAHQNRQREL